MVQTQCLGNPYTVIFMNVTDTWMLQISNLLVTRLGYSHNANTSFRPTFLILLWPSLSHICETLSTNHSLLGELWARLRPVARLAPPNSQGAGTNSRGAPSATCDVRACPGFGLRQRPRGTARVRPKESPEDPHLWLPSGKCGITQLGRKAQINALSPKTQHLACGPPAPALQTRLHCFKLYLCLQSVSVSASRDVCL